MIVLIRHAETAGGEGRYIGSTDLPLSPAGEAQARALATALGTSPLLALYVSPLQRARRTAAPLANVLGLEPVLLDELREIHLGQWEGLDREELRRTRPGEFEARGRDFAGYRPPGGESFADLALRAEAALRRMADGPQPCAAVTHAGLIRVLLCLSLGRPLDDVFRFRPAHTACTAFRQRPSTAESYESSPHFPFQLLARDISATTTAQMLHS